mgnify:FL=1
MQYRSSNKQRERERERGEWVNGIVGWRMKEGVKRVGNCYALVRFESSIELQELWLTASLSVCPTLSTDHLNFLVGWLSPISYVIQDADLSHDYRPVSSILGWIYFFAWSLSFYPQILLNFSRKTTVGFNTDKLVYDLIGFGCLSLCVVSSEGL